MLVASLKMAAQMFGKKVAAQPEPAQTHRNSGYLVSRVTAIGDANPLEN